MNTSLMRFNVRTLLGTAMLATTSIAVTACAPAEADPPHVAQRGSLTVVALDHSMSRTPQQISADSSLIAALVGRLSFADQLIIAEVHGEGRTDGAKRWETTMPGSRDAANPTPLETDSLARARRAAVNAVALLSQSRADQFNHTDLFANLYDAADFISGSRLPATRIILFSDMLQSTPSLNMEGTAGIPAATWVDSERPRIPQLTGACVAVIGADVSAPAGPALRQFWNAYFEAAGAHLRDYRLVMTDAAALHC